MNLEEIVNDYLNKFADSLDRELHFFESQPSLTETISRAAMAETSLGKQSGHQPAYRFSTKELSEAKRCLLEKEEQICTCKTFDELHMLVNKTIGCVYKNAVLYVYDTAWRIGAKLKLEPGVVYLHAGTRKGAEALGLNVKKRNTLELHELSVLLQQLRPIHIENLFCLYKDQFGNSFTEEKLPIYGC